MRRHGRGRPRVGGAPRGGGGGGGAGGAPPHDCAASKMHDGVSAHDSAGHARRRLLVPYTFGSAHLALSNLLCLAGAVAGGAGAWALKRYGPELWADEKGAPDWLVRLSLRRCSSRHAES